MPATAGRVRMPANNRVHSSAALQTHGIWQSAIGYDPYAPNKEDNKKSTQPGPQSSNVEPEGENAYASFQGLLALARITGSNADEARGSCKKCGRVGHLTFQCRNFLSIKEEKDKEKDAEAIQAAVMSGLERLKGNGVKLNGESSDESDDEEESESSDSDYDSEIERAIAKKYGKKVSSSKSKRSKNNDSDELDSGKKKKRGRSRSKKRRSNKRSTSDSDEEDVKRKSRKEKRRRRSHRHSDDSDSSEESSRRRHKRKSWSKRVASPSDSSDDSRVGRDKRRSKRTSRK